jgi:muramoyltetrapeptide carboxypeptidase LdcA involved in peptidoglycan recycling
LIGYSDITAILTLYARQGMTAIHGPMIDRRFPEGRLRTTKTPFAGS